MPGSRCGLIRAAVSTVTEERERAKDRRCDRETYQPKLDRRFRRRGFACSNHTRWRWRWRRSGWGRWPA